jgi:hypothetical protein
MGTRRRWAAPCHAYLVVCRGRLCDIVDASRFGNGLVRESDDASTRPGVSSIGVRCGWEQLKV